MIQLGTMVFLAPAASTTLAIAYFSSGESRSSATDWRAWSVNGLRGCSSLRLASASSRRAARSRTVSKSSFCSFFRLSWLALAGF